MPLKGTIIILLLLSSATAYYRQKFDSCISSDCWEARGDCDAQPECATYHLDFNTCIANSEYCDVEVKYFFLYFQVSEKVFSQQLKLYTKMFRKIFFFCYFCIENCKFLTTNNVLWERFQNCYSECTFGSRIGLGFLGIIILLIF